MVAAPDGPSSGCQRPHGRGSQCATRGCPQRELQNFMRLYAARASSCAAGTSADASVGPLPALSSRPVHSLQSALGFDAKSGHQEDAHDFLLRLLGALHPDIVESACGTGITVQQSCPVEARGEGASGPSSSHASCPSVTVRHDLVTCVSVPLGADAEPEGRVGPAPPGGIGLLAALQVRLVTRAQWCGRRPVRVQVGCQPP
jgi:hypothetical protein